MGELKKESIGNDREEGKHAFIQVGAIMIGLHTAARIRNIDVESIQVGADLLNGAEILSRRIVSARLRGTAAGERGYLSSGRAGFEDGALHAAGFAGCLVSDSMLFSHGAGCGGGVARMRERVHSF